MSQMPATHHALRLLTSPLYRKREADYHRTHAEAKARAAYYTTPGDPDAVWPGLFRYLSEETSHA